MRAFHEKERADLPDEHLDDVDDDGRDDKEDFCDLMRTLHEASLNTRVTPAFSFQRSSASVECLF
jgi:hypothetical protein